MNIEDVCAKCDHLSAMDLWPREQDLPYRSWLQNFDGGRQAAAAEVLNRLIFINEAMAYDALSCAYQRLLRAYARPATDDQIVPVERLTELHESMIVAPIRGEAPSATDSGFAYMRAARDHLGFKKSQINEDPLKAAELANGCDRPVVLIDDISGSGDQIRATLTRRTGSGPSLSTIGDRPHRVACLTAVITSSAYDSLAKEFPNIGVFAGHRLDTGTYGWPGNFLSEQRGQIQELLHWAAQRLQVPQHVDRLYGYHRLGLTLCFHNSIPDFSLPILWAKGGRNWTPLKGRPSG